MAVRRAAPVDERALSAEFPFLPGAEALLGELAPSIGALFGEAAFERARNAGRAQILAAIEDPSAGKEAPEIGRLDPDLRFLAFQFARLVLSAAPGRAPIRRWAVSEAKAMGDRLVRQPETVVQAIAERLGYDVGFEDGQAVIGVVDYLRLATPIREADFRLVRQPLAGGRIRLSASRAVRLLEEGVRLVLSAPVALSPGTRGAIEAREAEFLSLIASRVPNPSPSAGLGLGPVRVELFPPCMRAMRRTLEDGENLSHSGRFALAAFLHKAGASFDGIVDAYRGAPDFDESVTRYQVEHITRKDEGRGYEPPDCATLRTHGLCYREGDPKARDPVGRTKDLRCFDPNLRKPLQYYRDRSGSARASTAAPPAAPSAGPDTPATPG